MSRYNNDEEKSTAVEAGASTTAVAPDEKIVAAATALAEADILLLVTGAGWSADSGLPVYADIAKVRAYERRGMTYADVAQPATMEKDPALFYGFWGQALHDYRHTVPHSGFAIVEGWRRDKMQNNHIAQQMRERVKSKIEEGAAEGPAENYSFFTSEEGQFITPFSHLSISDMAGSFYCFTSNCDAHFYDFLPAVDIHDCHGNIELWQCSNRDCESGIWRAPTNWSIAVNSETLEAPPKGIDSNQPIKKEMKKNEYSTPRLGYSQGVGARNDLLQFMPPGVGKVSWGQTPAGNNEEEEEPNWPKCEHCQSLARPAIFMFGDFGWKYDHAQNDRWNAWRESVVELCRETSQSLKVCIMEVGCGKNVATCRTVSETLLEELIQTGFGDDVCLVRINPDFPEADDERFSGYVIDIPSRGLVALERIQQLYKKTMRTGIDT